MVLERVAGKPFAALLSDLLWRPIGAQDIAYIGVDGYGAARTSSGLCTTTRDLARLGQLVLEGGRDIVPKTWIDELFQGGDPAIWQGGSFDGQMPGARYRSLWYTYGQPVTAIGCWGIYGQSLFIHRQSQTVIAKHSSQSIPADFETEARQRAAFEAIANQLG